MRIRRSSLCLSVPLWVVASALGQGAAPTPPNSTPAPPPAAAKSVAAAPEGAQKKKGGSAARQLHIETIKVESEIATAFTGLRCDSDGNLYLGMSPDGLSGILKLDAKGKRLAVLQATPANFKINYAGYFSVGPDGDVYQVVPVADKFAFYVLIYKPDGSIRSEIKLDAGFPFFAGKVSPFPSGNFFISGWEYDKDRNNPVRWPFQGIFSSTGALLKELKFEDDDKIHDMAASGDPHVVTPTNPSSNLALSGPAETGADGNVYLMRRLSPAIFYAISAGGSVRRFEVDPGRDDFLPSVMHLAGSRIAVLFRKQLTMEEFLKVVDLEGHDVATYEEPVIDGEHALGTAFVCYANNPERFTFLTTTEDNKLGLIIATAQ